MIGFIDIHAHLLPGEDGPKDFEGSKILINMMIQEGISHVVCTPHYFCYNKYSKETFIYWFNKLKEYVMDKDISIYFGNELSVDIDCLKFIENGDCETLNKSKYILFEYPFFNVPIYYENIVYNILDAGYIPIIAHPERSEDIKKDIEKIESYKNMGCLIQMNAGSLTGQYGRAIKKIAKKMIKCNVVDIIASDTHSIQRRSPKVLKEVYGIVVKMKGQEVADKLCKINGLEIVKS